MIVRRIRFAIERFVFGMALGAARMVPRRVLSIAGKTLGSIVYGVDARHRRIAIDNLRASFGSDMDDRRRRSIAHACWRHFGGILGETLAFPRFSAAAVGREVRYRGLEHLRAAYEAGRGVLLFSGHFGHWELAAMMQGHLGLPIALVTRPLDNHGLERMLADLRGCSGNTVIHKRSAVREIVRALRSGGGVAILIDQDARSDGVFVPFLGRLASTTPTLALLAVRTGASIVPVFSVPGADGGWEITYEPPVATRPGADRDQEVLRVTTECTAIVERWVRAHPEVWLWMHRRWKTRPPEPSGSAAD